MISGEVRSSSKDLPSSDTMVALACRDSGTMAIGKAGASFLLERSWQGVEQRLGEDEIKPAEKGRSGLPINYSSEPIHREA